MGAKPNTLDIDLTDGHFYSGGRAREAYRWMRQNQPVFRDATGLAAAATYQAVIDAERNPQLFSNAGGIRPAFARMPYMIDMDDPEHLLRRKLVSAAFTGKRVRNKAPAILRMCDALIDDVCESGTCDLVRDIAAPLPMAVIGDMLGVLPEERATLLKWSEALVGGPSAPDDEASVQAVMDAFAAYTSFARDAIVERRSRPTDDLFSVLANAEIDGRRLSDDELIYESLLILIGGDETTRHTLSGGIEQLLRHRDQWEGLRNDPSLLPWAVEEMLRWTSPIKNMCRTLTTETEFHGVRLQTGEKIMLLFESANFDETVFGDPENFRIDRNPNNHLAFGFGTHFCLGNQLARLELSLMLARVLDRLPDLRLADSAELPRRPANFVSGLESMPVVFTPSRPVAPQ
ncbi:cytochrome [Mycobacterium sp. IEC1808]|uniref:cytochrome P450 n=1 Tax=Mycobacterium sp. IEC1808 TaxID=1743230 RepID=UPI000A1506E9|nr:cytochrome P450 [Mycobacterium sp. IEC1808]ORW85201.1 cytochrome [Mycobacterium sp. IEC1808]